jgi:hypothetical protein
MEDIRNQRTRLEKVSEKLYSNNAFDGYIERARIHEGEKLAPSNWAKKQEEEVKEEVLVRGRFSKTAKTIFAFCIFVFLLSGAFAFYQFKFAKVELDKNKVDVYISAASFAEGGENFPIEVTVANKNSIDLDQVDVIVEYPKGETLNLAQDIQSERILLGSVTAGGIKKTSANVILYGKEGNEREIKVRLEFNGGSKSTLYKKENSIKVSLKSSPVLMSIETLKEAAANQEVEIVAKVKALKGLDIYNFLVFIEYPSGFSFESSEPKTTYGNNTWFFDIVKAGQEKTIKIKGILRGENGDEKVFRVTGGAPDKNNDRNVGVVYGESKSSTLIQKPFISVSGTFATGANSSGDFILKDGEGQEVVINYKNNLGNIVKDVAVTAKLSGDLINRRSVIVPQGYFDSSKNTIVWDKNTIRKLASLSPGDSGELKFSFDALPMASKVGVSKDSAIKIDLAVKGKRATDKDVPEEVVVFNPIIGKFLTRGSVMASAEYYSGENPPRTEKDTVYKLNLAVKSKANKIKEGVLYFSLPLGVTYIKQETAEDVSYQESDRTLVWNLKDIEANSDSSTLTVEVSVKPSINGEDSSPVLTNGIAFEGIDAHTNTGIKMEAPSIKGKEIIIR